MNLSDCYSTEDFLEELYEILEIPSDEKNKLQSGWKLIKNKDLIIYFDNIDLILQNDKNVFMEILKRIIMVSSSSSKYHTKIVTSSICGVGDLDDIAEKIIVVENLSERTEEVKLL